LKSREKFLAVSDWTDSVSSMIRSGFLSEEDHKALTALARDGSSPCRVTRRANALVLLDEGWSCQQVAHALLLDDDTIRSWRCESLGNTRIVALSTNQAPNAIIGY
jgi:hypothetical protein